MKSLHAPAMSRQHHMPLFELLATGNMGKLATFMLMLLCLLPGQLHAQTSATAASSTDLKAPLVDWSHAQQVYRLSEKWLKIGDPLKELPGDPINVSGLTGVRVTLRWFGARMGTGESSFEASTPVHGKAINLTEMTRIAMRGAMFQVSEKLRQAALQAEPVAPGKPGFEQPRTVSELANSLLMDIQIAGRLQPIRIEAGSPADALYHQFAPGFHGLRMTTQAVDGTALASWIWPADTIAAGLTPHGQILQLMAGLGIKLDQANTVGRTGGPAIESFEVIHMVRPGLNQPITRLTRGNVLLPPTSIDGRTLDAMTSRLAAHLRYRQMENGQFPGTYLPSSDRNQTRESTLEDGALAILALSRWANIPSSAQAAETNKTVRLWIDTNIKDLLDPEKQPSPAALALTLLTLTQDPQLNSMKIQREMIATRLLRLRNVDGAIVSSEKPDAPQVDVPVGALVVDSLASYYLRSRSPEVAKALPDTMAWVWTRTDPLRSIGALPWLLEADAQLETLTDEQGQNPLNPRTERSMRLARLLPTIDIIMSRQIVTPPSTGPADVVGGFVLQEEDPSYPPNPDWRTAHMMMVISQSLRNRELAVGRNRVEGLLTCGRAARFLGQLMFDEPGTYYLRNPADAIGGVRPVLWDNHLDLAPTAMTLLAACDLRRTMEHWAMEQQK